MASIIDKGVNALSISGQQTKETQVALALPEGVTRTYALMSSFLELAI